MITSCCWEDARYWFNEEGRFNREDGPAIISPDGEQEWYINDINITVQVITWMKDMHIEPDYTKWTDSEKMWFKLRFCGISS